MINSSMTIRTIIDQHPETRELFVATGFGELVNGEKFDQIAPFLTLKSALTASGKEPEMFIKTLSKHIQENQTLTDITLTQDEQKDWNAVGVIPMAIHLQMLEAFDQFRTTLQEEQNITFEGKMASAQKGSGWLADLYGKIDDPRLMPDICLGRGFDFFFSTTFKNRFIETDIFHTTAPLHTNNDFKNIKLSDPRNNYRICSVIPAVLVIKESALNGLAVPHTWEELLSCKYKNRLAMPDCSADLPRAVLLTLYSHFGEEGVRNLAVNINQLLHPSQLVKKIRSNAADVPAISIMPYFFAKVIQSMPGVKIVWLNDGTIIEPLYVLAKSDPAHFKAEPKAVKAAKEFFLGTSVASIFTKGHFPTLHPDIDNGLPENVPLWWIGWDFIHKHDMIALAKQLHTIFDEVMADGNKSHKRCLCAS